MYLHPGHQYRLGVTRGNTRERKKIIALSFFIAPFQKIGHTLIMNTTTNTEATKTETKKYMTGRDIRKDMYIEPCGDGFKVYSKFRFSYPGVTDRIFDTDSDAYCAVCNYSRRYATKFDR